MNWIEKIPIIKGRLSAGLHLTMLENDLWVMKLVIVKLRGGLINIESSFNQFHSMDDLKEYLPKNIPIVLSVDGKGILHKKIKITKDIHPISLIIPGANANDFVIQEQKIDQDNCYFSVIRKSVANIILSVFRDNSYHIQKFILGPFSLNNLGPLIEDSDSQLEIEYYKIRFFDNLIYKLEISTPADDDKDYTIGAERINSWRILPFANALTFFTDLVDFSVDLEPSFFNPEEYYYHRIVRYAGLGFLGLMFFFLLINFYIFNLYRNKLDNLEKKYQNTSGLVEKLDKLRIELNIREETLENSGIMHATKYSYYADRIAYLMPSKVILSRLQIVPLIDDKRKEKPLQFQDHVILINGECHSSADLENWLEVLSKEDWIKEQELLHYSQDNLTTWANFILKLIIE